MYSKVIKFLIIGLLYSTIGYSQLYVKNNNYIFADDQVVFVEDNVGLQEADSKFYLRNGAQLVQGNGTTGNTGLGQLSVYQNGTVHEYAYNYWCSPVGNNTLASGNENFRVELIDESTGAITSQNVMFTPDPDGFVEDNSGNPTDLTISSEWLYTFETSAEYAGWLYQGESGNIAPGLGFTMKGIRGSGNNQLYDFRGKPNNGTMTNNVDEFIWTLVGNPYPSALDALEFIHDTDNTSAINGVLFFWEQDLSVTSHVLENYVGGYALYTISSDGSLETFIHAPFNTYFSDGTLNVAGTRLDRGKNLGRYIPIAQGFMVQGRSGTSGTVSTKNSHRVYEKESTTNGEFFRNSANNSDTTEDVFKSVPEGYKRFRLNIDFNDLYTRQLVQTFHDSNTTEGFDYGFDIPHNFTLTHDAYWMSTDNKSYTAQAQPLDIEATVLPLDMYLSEVHAIRFRIADVQNFDDNQSIYLHDKETDTYIDLTQEDANFKLDANYYSSRFEIVFKESNTQDTDPLISGFDVRHYTDDKQLSIYNYDNAIKSVSIYDMFGKRVMTFDNLGTQVEHTLDTSFLNPGPYVVNIEGEDDDSIIAKKIIAKR